MPLFAYDSHRSISNCKSWQYFLSKVISSSYAKLLNVDDPILTPSSLEVNIDNNISIELLQFKLYISSVTSAVFVMISWVSQVDCMIKSGPQGRLHGCEKLIGHLFFHWFYLDDTIFYHCNYQMECVIHSIMAGCAFVVAKEVFYCSNCDDYTSRFNEVERGAYWFHIVCPSVHLSIHLWTKSCPLCIFHNTSWIHFIFAHLIKQLQKVCSV